MIRLISSAARFFSVPGMALATTSMALTFRKKIGKCDGKMKNETKVMKKIWENGWKND